VNKSIFFRKKVKELALLNNIKEDIVIRQDNRLGGYLACTRLYLYSDTQEPVYLITYNAKLFKYKTKLQLMALALHELGHIKFRHEYKYSFKNTTKKQLIRMEYEAEKFSLLYIKNHYSKYFKKRIELLKNYITNDNVIYREAFYKLAKEFDK